MGFPCGSADKESTCNVGDLGLIPGLGRSSGEGNGYSLQCSYLENFMDKGAWQATMYGIAKSQTQLSNLQFFFPLVALVLVFKGTPIQSSIVVVSRRWRKESIIFLTEARGRWNLSTGILMGLESSSLSLVWVSQAFPCPTAFRSEFSQLSKNGDLSDREFPIPGFQCLVSAPGPPFK